MKSTTSYLVSVAAGLALAAIAIGADRVSVVRLDAGAWRCTAGHNEKIVLTRSLAGVEFGTSYACDQWSRR